MNFIKTKIGALLILGLGIVVQASEDMVILDANGVKNLKIETEIAEEREFEKTIFAIGRIIEKPSSRYLISSRISGRIVELNAYEGDYVKKGDVVAKIETRQLGDPPPTIEMIANRSGMVVASHSQLGQPVEPNADLMDIADRSTVWAVAKIPENEVAGVKKGTLARLRIPALGDIEIESTLLRFGVEADQEAGAIEGIFEIENTSGLLRPGMRAEFSIVLETRSDVMSIPRTAVQGDPARRVVFVKDFDLPTAFIRVPIVLGDKNDQYVEVLEGLFPGDEVVTQGSYSLGFVGPGSGISLKEALDMAHGHEHNEDGSEITAEQKAARKKEKAAEAGAVEEPSSNIGLWVYAIVMTFLCLYFYQRSKKGVKDAE